MTSHPEAGRIAAVAPSPAIGTVGTLAFATNLTNRQCALISDLFDPQGRRGAPARISRRPKVNAVLYQARTECQWRYLPAEALAAGNERPKGAVEPNMHRLAPRRQGPLSLRLLLGVVLAVAAFMLVFPVEATFVNGAGSDTVEYRTAKCGAPIASVLGADPDFPEGTTPSVGTVNASRSCEASSGKRAAAALLILLAAAVAGWSLERSRRSSSEP